MTIKDAELTRDTEFLAKMSPYVLVQHNGMSMKTRVIKSGGKKPSWNETLYLKVNKPRDSITFTVMD